MARYRTYNKLYFRGKPTGHAFIYHKSLNVKNRDSAKRTINKINAQWNRHEKNSGYKVKCAKIKRL